MFHKASNSCVGYLKYTFSSLDLRICKVPSYQGGGRMWKKDQHSYFFFQSSARQPRPLQPIAERLAQWSHCEKLSKQNLSLGLPLFLSLGIDSELVQPMAPSKKLKKLPNKPPAHKKAFV